MVCLDSTIILKMNNRWKLLIGTLVLVATTTWFAVWNYPEANLHIIACDVGQGDATLITYESTQILIDGGQSAQVLTCLANHMPFWDKSIELVVLTHPQADHYGGLIEVFRSYNVDSFLATELDSSSKGYQVLKSEVGGSGIEVVNPTTGMVIRLGKIYLDIVHPSSEFLAQNVNNFSDNGGEDVLGAFTTKNDPNDFSIVAILRFGEFDAFLTGDIGPGVIDDVLATGLIDDVEYIKTPHHGSKNGLTLELLEASMPEVAVISAGKDNRFGHPHKEILEMLESKGIEIFRTDEMGDVEIVSNGSEYWIE